MLILAALLLFAASGYYWYKNVLTDPSRTISDMLEKSLQTTSTVRTEQEMSGINSSERTVYMEFTPESFVQVITQLEEINEQAKTSVEVETIGTRDADYVRYNDVEVTGGRASGNFESILGQWAKRESNPQTGQAVSFLNDALFTAVPFGNLDSEQRREVINEIKRVNLYKYRDAKTVWQGGRPVIEYTLEVEPKALVQVLATYVKVTGAGSSAALDPAAYENAQQVRLRMSVDALSRHVKTIQFQNTERVENYAGYNMRRKVELPSKTIGIDELQSRLQSVAPGQQ